MFTQRLYEWVQRNPEKVGDYLLIAMAVAIIVMSAFIEV